MMNILSHFLKVTFVFSDQIFSYFTSTERTYSVQCGTFTVRYGTELLFDLILFSYVAIIVRTCTIRTYEYSVKGCMCNMLPGFYYGIIYAVLIPMRMLLMAFCGFGS